MFSQGFPGGEQADGDGVFEVPQVWPATKFLPARSLAGDGWRIDATVSNDGLFNTWEVASLSGPYRITGDERLGELLVEIEATGRLREVSKSKEFAAGLQDAAKAQWDAVSNVAKAPVDTVKKLPKGASRFLGKVGNTVKHTAQGTLDIDKSATPEQTARNVLGIERAKRLIAAELGVNPYSRNPALQQALNDVATVRAFGKLTVSVGSFIFVPATIGTALTGVNITNSLTKEQLAADPKELAAANRARAATLGVPSSAFEELNSNGHYDPWTRTAFWNSLAKVRAKGLAAFVVAAGNASRDLDAFSYLRVAQMMGRLQAKGGGIAEIVPLGGKLFACAMADGSLVFPCYFDYAIWTEKNERSVERFSEMAKSRNAPGAVIVTPGSFSPYAAERIRGLGLEIRENAAAAR